MLSIDFLYLGSPCPACSGDVSAGAASGCPDGIDLMYSIRLISPSSLNWNSCSPRPMPVEWISAVWSGARTTSTNPTVAQPNITIEERNGTIDHLSSSGINPVIGAPTRSPARSRYLIAKTTTLMTTSSAKNAVTATARKYSLSTSETIVDACSGNGGLPDSIHERHAQLLSADRSEEHTSELQSQSNLVCRLLLEKKNKKHK